MSKVNLNKALEAQRLTKEFSRNLDEEEIRKIMSSVRSVWPTKRSENDLIILINELNGDLDEINKRITTLWEEHDHTGEWKDVDGKKNKKKEVPQPNKKPIKGFKQGGAASKQRQGNDTRNRGQYDHGTEKHRNYNKQNNSGSNYRKSKGTFEVANNEQQTDIPEQQNPLQSDVHEEVINDTNHWESDTVITEQPLTTVVISTKEAVIELSMGASRSDNLGPTASAWGTYNPSVYEPVFKGLKTNNINQTNSQSNTQQTDKKKKKKNEAFPTLSPNISDQKLDLPQTNIFSQSAWSINNTEKNNKSEILPLETDLTQQQQIPSQTDKIDISEKVPEVESNKYQKEVNKKNKPRHRVKEKKAEVEVTLTTSTNILIETEENSEKVKEEIVIIESMQSNSSTEEEIIEIFEEVIQIGQQDQRQESSLPDVNDVLIHNLNSIMDNNHNNNQSDVNIILNVPSTNNDNINNTSSVLVFNPIIQSENSEINPIVTEKVIITPGPVVNFGHWEDDISENGDICFGFDAVCIDDDEEEDDDDQEAEEEDDDDDDEEDEVDDIINSQKKNEETIKEHLNFDNNNTSSWSNTIEHNSHYLNDDKQQSSLFNPSDINNNNNNNSNNNNNNTSNNIINTSTTPPPPGFDELSRPQVLQTSLPSSIQNQLRSDLPPGLDSPNVTENNSIGDNIVNPSTTITNNNNNNNSMMNNQSRTTNYNPSQDVLSNQIHSLAHGGQQQQQQQQQDNIRSNNNIHDGKQDKKYHERNSNNTSNDQISSNSQDNNLRQKHYNPQSNTHPLNQQQQHQHPHPHPHHHHQHQHPQQQQSSSSSSSSPQQQQYPQPLNPSGTTPPNQQQQQQQLYPPMFPPFFPIYSSTPYPPYYYPQQPFYRQHVYSPNRNFINFPGFPSIENYSTGGASYGSDVYPPTFTNQSTVDSKQNNSSNPHSNIPATTPSNTNYPNPPTNNYPFPSNMVMNGINPYNNIRDDSQSWSNPNQYQWPHYPNSHPSNMYPQNPRPSSSSSSTSSATPPYRNFPNQNW